MIISKIHFFSYFRAMKNTVQNISDSFRQELKEIYSEHEIDNLYQNTKLKNAGQAKVLVLNFIKPL